MRCKDCRFYEANGDLHEGDCHRFPPSEATIEFEGNLVPAYKFAGVDQEDWCGEFQPNADGKQISERAIPEHLREKREYKASLGTIFNNAIINCLRRAELKTIEDVTSQTAEDLLQIQHFGTQRLAQVRQALAGVGLSLRGE